MPLRVDRQDHADGTAVIRFEGSLSDRDIPQVREATFPALLPGRRVVLDLSGVEECDAAGLGMILAMHAKAQQIGATVAMAGPAPAVAHELERFGFADTFPIHPSVGEALQPGRHLH